MKMTSTAIFLLLVLAGCSDRSTHNDAAAQSEGRIGTSVFANANEHQEEISKYDSISVERHVSRSYRDMMMSGMQGKSDRNSFLGAFDCSTLPYIQHSPIKTPDSIHKLYRNDDGSYGCEEVTYLPNFDDYGDVSFTIVTKIE